MTASSSQTYKGLSSSLVLVDCCSFLGRPRYVLRSAESAYGHLEQVQKAAEVSVHMYMYVPCSPTDSPTVVPKSPQISQGSHMNTKHNWRLHWHSRHRHRHRHRHQGRCTDWHSSLTSLQPPARKSLPWS